MRAFRFMAVVEENIKNEIEINSEIKIKKFVSVILESFGIKARKGSFTILTCKKGKSWDNTSKLDSAQLDASFDTMKIRVGKKLFLQLRKDSDRGIELQCLKKTEISNAGIKIISSVGSLNPKQIEELTGAKKLKVKTETTVKNSKKTSAKTSSKAPSKTPAKISKNNKLAAKKKNHVNSVSMESELSRENIQKNAIIDKIINSQDVSDENQENDDDYNYEKSIKKTGDIGSDYLEDDDTEDIFEDGDFSDEEEFDDDDYFDTRDDFSDFYYDDNDDDDEKYY